MENIQNDIQKELDRLIDLKGSDNWSLSTRNKDLYDLIIREYSFGKRLTYYPKINENYVNLQSSRSLNVEENDNLNNFIKKAENNFYLNNEDLIRINEIKENIKIINNFVELGFRIPKNLEYYKVKYGAQTSGYDVVPISVMAGKFMGYDVNLYDLSICEDDLDLKEAELIVCYHVLEHISDPLVPIKKIYQEMNYGAFFHVEVPIEPGIPRLQYGHLFPFETEDLKKMLEETGFKIIKTTITSTIERHLVTK